jgi:hypothetical protein
MRYKFPQFKIHELGSAWGAFAQCDLTGRRAPGSRRDSIVHTLLLLDDQCRNRDVIRKHPDTSLNEAEPSRKRKSVHAQCFSAGAILSLLETFGDIWRPLWPLQLGRCWRVRGNRRGHSTLTCTGWSSADSGQAPSTTVLRQCLLMGPRPASNSRSSPHDPPTSASRVAGIIAVCHHSQPSVHLSRFRGFCLNAVSRATN